ncbi:hypothetical protein [Candidatus Phytoplasma solani]|uniref:hypothetical protein n=1 Tax=Candidatus Phytoplasma solani TaxID=69896 RepID=UPI00358ED574
MQFKYLFNKQLFISNSMFAFTSYSVNCITNMIRILNEYSTKNWEILKKLNFHSVKKKQILSKQECFGDFNFEEYKIFLIKITHIERLLFVKSNNICYPIGYDKYHFLYSQRTNNNEINVNSLKHYLYHQFRNLIGNEKSTKITNDLIKNQISFKDKNALEIKVNMILEKYSKQFPNKYNKKKQEIQEIITNHF